MRLNKRICLGLAGLCLASQAHAADWLQYQNDAAHRGRTTDSVAPPYRLRWMWLGEQNLVRNQRSNPSWTGPNLAPGEVIADKATLPASVPFTFAWGMQPVVVSGKVVVADMDGSVIALAAADGSLLWRAENPGGSIASGAFAAGVVAFGSLSGDIRGYDLSTGDLKWEVATDGPITAPVTSDGNLFCVGSHDERVYCLEPATGAFRWVSPPLGAQVCGACAIDGDAVYVGSEAMLLFALKLSDGTVRAFTKVRGQSFCTQWPVVHGGLVFVEAAAAPAIGSEYVGEDLMAASADATEEQHRWRDWLLGHGGYEDATPEWKHLTVLRTSDLQEPFVVPSGPFEGCGQPPYPPVIDNDDNPITYFKTRFPSFTHEGAFGTKYSVDISRIDPMSGNRVLIDNGKLSGNWMWDTDNLYVLSVGGHRLYQRHYDRGLFMVDLGTSETSHVLHHTYEYGNAEGVSYVHEGAPLPETSLAQLENGKNAGVPSVGALFVVEPFGLVAVEHHE